MKITKREVNLFKLMNLSSALNECGIDNELCFDEENNIISLSAEIWNCVDGSEVEFCVYCAEFEDDFEELHSYCDPHSQSAALFADFVAEN